MVRIGDDTIYDRSLDLFHNYKKYDVLSTNSDIFDVLSYFCACALNELYIDPLIKSFEFKFGDKSVAKHYFTIELQRGIAEAAEYLEIDTTNDDIKVLCKIANIL